MCGFPRCINKNKVGDGVVDCVEGSDEREYAINIEIMNKAFTEKKSSADALKVIDDSQ